MSNEYPAGANPAEKTFVLLRAQMIKMVIGVLLFFVSYCVLLSFVLLLGAGCIGGGVLLIKNSAEGARSITLLGGGAAIILGIVLVIYLVRFLFHRHKPVNPYRMEIFAEEHPTLFAFIHQLATETNTRLPKHVFLVPEVNAGVFYNSSFLSMFWPSGKNLEIGMGLVNCLNISEFRMALAHEFGHFSQRSMVIGSYVYTLNKVVNNMLHENDRLDDVIIRWSNIGVLQFATYPAKAILYLLRKMYYLMNRQYMKLSREMEFHADAVALEICGTATAISTMRRTEMSIFCFGNCLQQLPQLAEEQLKFENIYEVHLAMIRHYASRNNVPLDTTQLPLITDDYFKTFLTSRVQLRNQWASHPTREERERRYLDANIPSQTVPDSAWTLFNEPQQLQETMSALIYEMEVPECAHCTLYDVADFISDMEVKQVIFALQEHFHEYYDNRPFPTIHHPHRLSDDEMENLSSYVLYNPENALRIRHYFRNRQDAETLQAVADGDIKTRYFEFEGIQYPVAEARAKLVELQKSIEKDGDWLQQHDQTAFCYHYTLAIIHGEDAGPKLLEQYQLVKRHEQNTARFTDIFVKVTENIIFEKSHFKAFQQAGLQLKQFLQELKEESVVYNLLDTDLRYQIHNFLLYDLDNVPEQEEIDTIYNLCFFLDAEYGDKMHHMKKALLEMMLPA
jgi:Zn-dependent protease with chaperone function